MGRISETALGNKCVPWTTHMQYKDIDFPDGSVDAASNFCRNPENDPKGEELVSIKTFKDLFVCPICFNLMKDPEAVRYCMHKFCSICVLELSKSTKQCP